MTQSHEDVLHEPKMELTETSESSIRVKKIATAAILGALSIAIAPIVEVLPRFPGWGIAYFDPVSFLWIIAFLIGGLYVGLVATIAGFIGLFLWDPTGIGPIFKFLATAPMIIIPWVGMRLKCNRDDGSFLAKPKTYAILMFMGFIVRLAVMIPANMLYLPNFDLQMLLVIALTINTVQSIFDALIPFIIVHGTPIFKHYGMW